MLPLLFSGEMACSMRCASVTRSPYVTCLACGEERDQLLRGSRALAISNAAARELGKQCNVETYLVLISTLVVK